MKLLNLSLATAIAMGSAAFGADSLADAFSNGALKGQLKAFYFDRDKGTGTVKGDILNFGVKLDYVTDSFYGFKAGIGIQSSNSPFADEDAKTVFQGDMWGPGALLSEAYLSYTMNKTTLKVGRQYIQMPLLKSSRSRLIHQSFEGATLVSKALSNTTFYGAYINKFQNRVDGSGDIADFNDLIGDYAYVIGLENKSIKGTTLTAAYGEADKSHSMYYLEAKYMGHVGSISYNSAAQYGATDYDNATKDANFYGVKIGAGIGGFNAYVAYAEVQDGTAKWGVAGGGAKPTIFTTAIIDAGQYNESEQYAIDANYKFGMAKIGARYINVDNANNDEIDYQIAYASYKFNGMLKGLASSVVYEDEDHDTDSLDNKELWFKLTYSF